MTAPRVDISDAAKQWLRERGSAVSLRHARCHGCCGGSVDVPVADPHAPADGTRYTHARIDGLDVYIAPDLNAPGAVRVGLEGFWRWRRLTVEGAALASTRAEADGDS